MEAAKATTSKGSFQVYCCNPLKKSNHDYFKKSLRPVNENIVSRSNTIKLGDRICDSCRKAILKLPKLDEVEEWQSDSDNDNNVETREISTPQKEEAIDTVNISLVAIDETPIKKKRLTEKKYPEEKLKKVSEAFRTKLMSLSPCSQIEEKPDIGREMINQLKEKFHSTSDKSLKMQILTTLPQSWTSIQIETEFGVSNFIARKVKKLVKEKGIMSSPDPRPGKTLDLATVELVKEFYENDEVSRQMPGLKDFVSVKIDGKRTHVQKFLLLCTLRELYVLFKERYLERKIGFTKFCELRPKQCVLAGSSGTHSVCVCMIHQNAKLMMDQCKIPQLTSGEPSIKTYKDLTSSIVCKDSTPRCHFVKCEKCPGSEKLKIHFQNCFEEECIENVTFKHWMQIDNKTTLETVTMPVNDFVDRLFESLPKLLRHSFIAKQQSAYLKQLKDNILPDEYIVICDFAENYSFVLQDAVQGFHWNNAQATIHPIIIYYRGEDKEKLEHINLVIISDCMSHNTVAVHLFQRMMIDFLKQKRPSQPQKIHYFSDGAASQYKNKYNFLNLCFHKVDFDVEAEWNFFASSHGKNVCDGVGGTVKRLAAQASLRMVYNDQIMTPRQLYDWAKENIPSVNFLYTTQEDHETENTFLEQRMVNAKTIKGTQQLHSFIPVGSTTKLNVKEYSFSTATKEEIVSLEEKNEQLELSEIVGFVTCNYSNQWWLGCVLGIENEFVNISFLEPHGPSPSFKYPQFPDILGVSRSDVLTKVDPITQTGRVYKLTTHEMEKASKILAQRRNKN